MLSTVMARDRPLGTDFLERYHFYKTHAVTGVFLTKRCMKSCIMVTCQLLPSRRATYLDNASFTGFPVFLAPSSKHFAKEQMERELALCVG